VPVQILLQSVADRRHPLIRYSPHRKQHGKAEFEKAQRAGEEGVIAKRAASRYWSGKRTREWLKIKARHQQEAIIVGEGVTHPMRIRFADLPAEHRPRGESTNFPRAWQYVAYGRAFTEKVVSRWRRQSA